MFLTVHTAAGLLAGKYFDSSLLAFLVGFLSHQVLDMVPKHDSIEIEKWKMSDNKKFTIVVLFIEFPLIAALLFGLHLTGNLIFTPSIIAGIIGAVIMDFLWGLYLLYPKKNNPFKLFYAINGATHKIFKYNAGASWKIWLPIHLFVLAVFVVWFLL